MIIRVRVSNREARLHKFFTHYVVRVARYFLIRQLSILVIPRSTLMCVAGGQKSVSPRSVENVVPNQYIVLLDCHQLEIIRRETLVKRNFFLPNSSKRAMRNAYDGSRSRAHCLANWVMSTVYLRSEE